MNTLILKGATFYEFEGYYNGDIEGVNDYDIIGRLLENDRTEIDCVTSGHNYIITYIKEENGEHVAKYVNGLELKLNYRIYNNESHGGLNIWNANDLIEII